MSGARSRSGQGGKRADAEAQERGARHWSGTARRRLVALAIVGAAGVAAAVIAVVAFGGRGKVETAASAASAAAARSSGSSFRTVLESGGALTGRDLGGRPTAVAFVIENCASCIGTLRTLTALSESGVRTIAVNVNVPPGTSAATAARRLASFGRAVNASGRIVYAADPGQRTAAAFGVREIESYLLFDARGREIGQGVELSARQIRRALGLA